MHVHSKQGMWLLCDFCGRARYSAHLTNLIHYTRRTPSTTFEHSFQALHTHLGIADLQLYHVHCPVSCCGRQKHTLQICYRNTSSRSPRVRLRICTFVALMAPTEQTAVQIVGSGQDYHEVLEVATQPVVAPQEGEVLVRVLLRPINPVHNLKCLNLSYRRPPKPGDGTTISAHCMRAAPDVHTRHAVQCISALLVCINRGGPAFVRQVLFLADIQADVYKITGQTNRDHIPLPFNPGNEGATPLGCILSCTSR